MFSFKSAREKRKLAKRHRFECDCFSLCESKGTEFLFILNSNHTGTFLTSRDPLNISTPDVTYLCHMRC